MSDDESFEAALTAGSLLRQPAVPKTVPKQRAALLKALGVETVAGAGAGPGADDATLQRFLPFVAAHSSTDHSFDFGTVLATVPLKVSMPVGCMCA